MADSKLKICLVGVGMIGRIHAQSYVRHNDKFDLYVCDANNDVARTAGMDYGAVAVFDDYEEVLSSPDIEAVDICLPHHLHAKTAIAGLEAGKHVLLEKPYANSLAEADAITDAAEKTGLVIAISENFRFEPAIKRATEIIELGAIGKPFLITIQEMSYTVELTSHMAAYDWRRLESTGGGGVLFDRGVHLMATVNQLGGPVRSVYAKEQSPAKIWEVDETSVVTMVHDNSIVTSLIHSWNVRSAPYTPCMAVYGSEGSIFEIPEKRVPGHGPFEIGGLVVYSAKNPDFQAPKDDDLFNGAKLYVKEYLNAEVPDDVLARTLARGIHIDIVSEFGAYSVYDESILDFLACVRTGKKPHGGPDEARADIELVFAAYESAKSGMPVTLPLKG